MGCLQILKFSLETGWPEVHFIKVERHFWRLNANCDILNISFLAFSVHEVNPWNWISKINFTLFKIDLRFYKLSGHGFPECQPNEVLTLLTNQLIESELIESNLTESVSSNDEFFIDESTAELVGVESATVYQVMTKQFFDDSSSLTITVGVQIPNAWIPNTSEIRTFWILVFKWSRPFENRNGRSKLGRFIYK